MEIVLKIFLLLIALGLVALAGFLSSAFITLLPEQKEARADVREATKLIKKYKAGSLSPEDEMRFAYLKGKGVIATEGFRTRVSEKALLKLFRRGRR